MEQEGEEKNVERQDSNIFGTLMDAQDGCHVELPKTSALSCLAEDERPSFLRDSSTGP